MIRKKKIEVRPLKKSYQPKYPSYADPNPLDHPESKPYPFTLKMMNSLSAAGFLGTIMFSCGAQTKAQIDHDTISPITQDSLKNTFPISATNLPYHPAMFGTGLPSRLSSRDVIDVLNLAFTEEGLNPVLDTTLRIDGQSIPVSAYDPKTKIGYIWMDYDNYGEGMIEKRYASRKNKKQNSRKSIRKRLKSDIDHLVESYNQDPFNFLKWRVQNNNYAAEFKAKLGAELSVIEDENARQKYLKKEITKYTLQARVNRVLENNQDSFRNRWSRSAIKHIEDKEDLYITLNQIGGVSNLYSFEPNELNILMEAIADLDIHTHKKDWNKHSKALIDLLSVGAPSSIQRHPKYRTLLLDIVASSDYRKWKSRHEEILTLIDNEQISFKELKALDGNDEYFIAPVSRRDDRSTYRPDYYHRSEEMQALRKQMRAEDDPAKKVLLQKEWEKLVEILQEKEEEIEKEAIRAKAIKLQEDMRGYIRWAKNQIGY